MKKTLILILLTILITGCGEKKQKEVGINLLDEIKIETENANMICSSNIKDNQEYEIATKIAVYLDSNDIVTTIESAEIIASENIDILNDFESYYNSNYEKIGNYGGYTYDIHQEKKRLLANVIIDYNTFNTEAYVADYPEIAETFNEEYKMTKDKLIETYKNQGIECEIKQD